MMSEVKTVMIVGAGASREALLPTGAELKDIIAEMLDFTNAADGRIQRGDGMISQTFRQLAHDEGSVQRIQQYISAAWHIRDALPVALSIDNFLDSHSGNREIEICGKLAIVRAILKAERGSNLWVDDSNIHNKLELIKLKDTWYLSLGQLLFSCRKNEIEGRLSSVSFIVFNYDRCVEHFIFWGLKIYFGFDDAEAARIAGVTKIYHPYGVAGLLPWQGGVAAGVAFGPEAYDLVTLSKQIKTFTEGTDRNSSEIVALRRDLDEAETVVFLGFGFHELNMELISPEKKIPTGNEEKAYYATAAGRSKSDCRIVEEQLTNLCSVKSSRVYVRSDLYCHNLFSEYNLSLSI